MEPIKINRKMLKIRVIFVHKQLEYAPLTRVSKVLLVSTLQGMSVYKQIEEE